MYLGTEHGGLEVQELVLLRYPLQLAVPLVLVVLTVAKQRRFSSGLSFSSIFSFLQSFS